MSANGLKSGSPTRLSQKNRVGLEPDPTRLFTRLKNRLVPCSYLFIPRAIVRSEGEVVHAICASELAEGRLIVPLDAARRHELDLRDQRENVVG